MRTCAVAFLLLLSEVTFPQGSKSVAPDSSVVLRGPNYGFVLSVPGDWVLEPGHGTWVGVKAILYPRNAPESRAMWGNPDAWITVGIASKQTEGKETLGNLATFFAKADSHASMAVSAHAGVLTRDKKTAAVTRSVGSARFGARALVDDKSFVAVFELCRFDEREFNDSYPIFTRLVESYQSAEPEKKPAR